MISETLSQLHAHNHSNNTLQQHTATTHGNILQHTATHCNTRTIGRQWVWRSLACGIILRLSTLSQLHTHTHTATTHCNNTLQHTATRIHLRYCLNYSLTFFCRLWLHVCSQSYTEVTSEKMSLSTLWIHVLSEYMYSQLYWGDTRENVSLYSLNTCTHS